MKRETMWKCEVGVRGQLSLPPGADEPMRRAIRRAFREITGRDAEFIFSGWGDELTDAQRAVVEKRGPNTDGAHFAELGKVGRS